MFKLFSEKRFIFLMNIFMFIVFISLWFGFVKISTNINYNIPKETTQFVVYDIIYSTNVLSLYKVVYFQDDKNVVKNTFTFVDSVKKYNIGDVLFLELK